jgi:hypothetical protein
VNGVITNSSDNSTFYAFPNSTTNSSASSINIVTSSLEIHDSLYFMIVTLSTVGYGDI